MNDLLYISGVMGRLNACVVRMKKIVITVSTMNLNVWTLNDAY